MQSTTPTVSEQAEAFARNGVLVVPGVFAREEAQAWKEECRRLLDRLTAEAQARGAALPKFRQSGVFVGLSINSSLCRAFARDPRLLDLMEPLIGPNIMFWSDKVVFKAEEVAENTPWHQDWAYWHGCHKLNAWIALDDVDPANGCLKLVPGSQSWSTEHDGRAAPGAGFVHRVDPRHIDEAQVVTAAVPAGSVVIFHDLTLHASYPNTSGRERWAAICTYKDAQVEDLDYPAMTAAAIVRGSGSSLPVGS
jgi:ectoine hydroxylase-related dioxygenase (phytanoyl-CoA dioxygenase family)